LGGFKGDVARGVLYMEIRYNGLTIENGFPEVVGQMGDLQTILNWHRNDAPDDFEMNRNNVVYQWQRNRNPFIDLPELVEYIWGNKVGEVWDQELSVADNSLNTIILYPNPANDYIAIKGITGETQVEIITLEGRQIKTELIYNDAIIDLDISAGMYLIRISGLGSSVIKKILVN
jgi:hypothetical protein